MKAEVELMNTEPQAVAAVRATLEMAPLNARLVEEGGKFFIEGSDFAVFAAVHQGYVKKVVNRTE